MLGTLWSYGKDLGNRHCIKDHGRCHGWFLWSFDHVWSIHFHQISYNTFQVLEGCNDDFLLPHTHRFIVSNGNHDLTQLQNVLCNGESRPQCHLSGTCSHGRNCKCLHLNKLDNWPEDIEVSEWGGPLGCGKVKVYLSHISLYMDSLHSSQLFPFLFLEKIQGYNAYGGSHVLYLSIWPAYNQCSAAYDSLRNF